MDLGKEILRYRAKHNLTQTELADKLGVALITIHRAEKNGTCGKLTRIKFEELLKEEGEV